MENAYLFVPVVISLIVSLFAWRAVFLRAMKVYALALGLVVVMSLGLYIAAVTANGIAAKNATSPLFTIYPGRTINWCTLIIPIPLIFHPFKNIPTHITDS